MLIYPKFLKDIKGIQSNILFQTVDYNIIKPKESFKNILHRNFNEPENITDQLKRPFREQIN